MATPATAPTHPPGSPDRAPVLGVVFVYFIFATLWILFSDKAVELLFDTTEEILLASVVKGWLFVVVTSILLYGLVQRLRRAESGAETTGIDSIRRPFTLLALFVIAMTTLGVVQVAATHRVQAYERLEALAQDKSRQIQTWLHERRLNASFVQSSRHYAHLYAQRLRDAGSLSALMQRLTHYAHLHGFTAITLYDASGARVAQSENAPAGDGTAWRTLAQDAVRRDQVLMSVPYLDDHDQALVDLAVPLPPDSGERGIVIMHIDLRHWLYPLLREWPQRGSEGEASLFRAQGGRIVHFTPLEHHAGRWLYAPHDGSRLASAYLRTPATDVPVREGFDYRGAWVAGIFRDIEGTDWHLLVETTQWPWLLGALPQASLVLIAGITSLFVVYLALRLLRHRQQIEALRSTRHAQDERMRALNLLGAVVDSSDDAILAKDLDGRYLLFNPAAERFTGKSANEVLGQDDFFLFPRAEALALRDIGQRVIDEARIVTELEELTTPLGPRAFLATKGPLRDESGRIIGLFGISRDITERRQDEARLLRQTEELRRRNEELERFNRATVGRELDMIALKREVNELCRRLGEPPAYDMRIFDDGQAGRP